MTIQLCNCLTKTPDPVFHKTTCPVYLEYMYEGYARLLKGIFVTRQQTTPAEMKKAIDSLYAPMLKRLDRHGYGLASGTHEIFGILAEEMDELLDEMRANNDQLFYDELVDVAIAAIFGMVCIQRKMKFKEQ